MTLEVGSIERVNQTMILIATMGIMAKNITYNEAIRR